MKYKQFAIIYINSKKTFVYIIFMELIFQNNKKKLISALLN